MQIQEEDIPKAIEIINQLHAFCNEVVPLIKFSLRTAKFNKGGDLTKRDNEIMKDIIRKVRISHPLPNDGGNGNFICVQTHYNSGIYFFVKTYFMGVGNYCFYIEEQINLGRRNQEDSPEYIPFQMITENQIKSNLEKYSIAKKEVEEAKNRLSDIERELKFFV
jgi:hypothetical protein